MPSANEIKNWLLAEDAARLGARVSRLKFVVKEYGASDGVQLWHGVLSERFFEEARWCFVNGQFIACVLLSQCFLEVSLRSILAAGGENYGVSDKWLESAGFADLVNKAKECGLIEPGQAANCHAVRQMRVEYVHARPVFSKKHIGQRMVAERASAMKLSERDARRSMRVMLDLNRRFSRLL